MKPKLKTCENKLLNGQGQQNIYTEKPHKMYLLQNLDFDYYQNYTAWMNAKKKVSSLACMHSICINDVLVCSCLNLPNFHSCIYLLGTQFILISEKIS